MSFKAIEPRLENSNNVVCATSKASDQPDSVQFGVCKLKRGLHRFLGVYTCQNATLLEITCHGSIVVAAWWTLSDHNFSQRSLCVQVS